MNRLRPGNCYITVIVCAATLTGLYQEVVFELLALELGISCGLTVLGIGCVWRRGGTLRLRGPCELELSVGGPKDPPEVAGKLRATEAAADE